MLIVCVCVGDVDSDSNCLKLGGTSQVLDSKLANRRRDGIVFSSEKGDEKPNMSFHA